ncbi:MAG: DUF2141 domain-containing protein [Cyclobacteriaceae bacterium]|nr:DUF2141 domain-containing protein [Cyclobacteriaceae bacterium]
MMCRIFFLVILSLILENPVVAQARVEVIVTGISDTPGTVLVALFDNPATFLKKPMVGKSVAGVSGQAKVVFDNVEPGEYAASIIHDTNGNLKLDTNFLGIPREGFGFSNDAMGTFGPPSFDKAKFTVAGPVVIRIKAKYF